MIEKTYKGWEIIKMLEEDELTKGTILQDEDENFYTVFKGALLDGKRDEFNSHYETTISFLVKNSFTIIDTRKKRTFNEAFVSLEDGKEIEDKYGMRYRKSKDGNIEYKANHMENWERCFNDCNVFSVDTIKGYWYIHN